MRHPPIRPRCAVPLVLGFALLGAAACGAPTPPSPNAEHPPGDVYRHDTARPNGFVPNPAFAPVTPTYGINRSKLSLEGEVLVLEGDAQTVSSAGGGSYGIRQQNQTAIVQEVLAVYPDVFDTIQIYTTFIDEANVGTAYYQSISNSIAGIGVDTWNGRPSWGLPEEGRLSGFSNMNSMLQWGNGRVEGISQVGGFYHAVVAQELSHKWLFRFKFTDASGNSNESLIGRQDAHWSRLAHANGSVQDGNFWTDNGDGTFKMEYSDRNFAPLDLYGMGFIGAEEVEDFFYLVEATLNGMMLNKTSNIPVGAVVNARRIDVTMSQVLNEMGPRNPPVGTETPYHRAAFVLVTAPGETRTSFAPHLEEVKITQETFPESWRMWTSGRGAICTKISERCPEPVLGLAGYAVSDGGDDLVAPGETFSLALSVQNVGMGTAEGAQIELESLDPLVTVASSAGMTAPPIPENESVALPAPFSVTVSAEAPCGIAVPMRAKLTTKEGPIFYEQFEIGVGTKRVRFDPLDEAPNWVVDPDGNDTAFVGQWALGEPEFASVLGVVTQPAADHTPGESKLSFHTGPELRGFFSTNDLDGGKSTLESPVFAVKDTRDPTLVFYYWRLAQDFSKQGGPQPVPDTDLIVLASNDGGESWVEMGRFVDDTEEWTRAELSIRDALEPTNRMKFRFVISDESTSGTVEAGIDDLEVIDFLDGCDLPDRPGDADAGTGGKPGTGERDGCGCSAVGSKDASFFLLLLGLALLGVWRRAR